MVQVILYVIVAVLLLEYLLELFLGLLNARQRKSELPSEVNDVYNEERYRKYIAYDRINHRFSILTSTFNTLIILAMVLTGGFAIVDHYVAEISSHPIWNALLFFAVLMLASDIINTPFSVYDTFHIEEKFGFNRTTVKTFILDKIKGWFIAGLLGGLILAFIIWFYLQAPNYFWLYAWILISVFSIFMTAFYTSLILPLFNKLTPMENGELKEKIMNFGREAGFSIKNVYIIDGSKRSTKANAFFSGLGKQKKIVLFDTLLDKLSGDEIVAVLAHEIGHYKKKHTLGNVAFSILQTGLMLYILGLFVSLPAFSKALGAETAKFHLGLLAFSILYSPISMIIGLLGNIYSRQNEYQADAYATGFGLGNSLIDSLKKLSVNNLSNLNPHPLYVFFHYSHPPLIKRIRAIKALER